MFVFISKTMIILSPLLSSGEPDSLILRKCHSFTLPAAPLFAELKEAARRDVKKGERYWYLLSLFVSNMAFCSASNFCFSFSAVAASLLRISLLMERSLRGQSTGTQQEFSYIYVLIIPTCIHTLPVKVGHFYLVGLFGCSSLLLQRLRY